MTAARDERPGLDDLGPTALLDALAAEDLARRIADRNILRIVHQWAVLHPATTESGTATWGGDAMLLVDESLGGDGYPGQDLQLGRGFQGPHPAGHLDEHRPDGPR